MAVRELSPRNAEGLSVVTLVGSVSDVVAPLFMQGSSRKALSSISVTGIDAPTVAGMLRADGQAATSGSQPTIVALPADSV
jgi:hypothetical protein